MRPLIAIDGTHLRGKYPSVLLIAVTHDGDHGIFPIAFGIAEIENFKTWEWFLAAFSRALRLPQNLTIVSDRMKGLTRVVAERFPDANHCYCVCHISEKIRERFKDDGICRKFWNAAHAFRPCEYERHMNDIRTVNERAYKYIEDIGKQHWANAFVLGKRYDMLTTNCAKATNSLLKGARELPITKMVEAIRSKLMEFFKLRRLKSHVLGICMEFA